MSYDLQKLGESILTTIDTQYKTGKNKRVRFLPVTIAHICPRIRSDSFCQPMGMGMSNSYFIFLFCFLLDDPGLSVADWLKTNNLN